jgi:hypothetical protein
MRDALKAADVYRNKLAVAARPRRRLKDMAYAAQISFAFLPDVADSDHRLTKPQPYFARRA